MGKKILRCLFVCLFMMTVLYLPKAVADAIPHVKISVFNFGTVSLEASGYGTTVTNMLVNCLGAERSLNLLDRKELEAFLNLNDYQQNDNLDNVVNIGTKLGLNVIVVGSIEKKGSIIIVNCKVIHIEQKRPILNTQLRSLGDVDLMKEIRKLSSLITTAISGMTVKQKGPVNVQKRAGNNRVFLNWDEPPGMETAGYEVFRSNSESGPFARIVRITQSEYLDQDLDRNTTYYYKIRAFNNRGLQSDFSPVISAESALTPNPPVILKAEGHIRSVQLTWSPSPMASDDPLKLKGYKLYRAKVPQGPYKEVANVPGTDLGIGADASTTLDKLFKVSYLGRGLADGEDYYYRLTAYNEKNLESDFSPCIKSTTILVVSGLTARGDMIREIKLAWGVVDSPFITGYYVYRSTSETGGFKKIKKIDAPTSEKKINYTDNEGLSDKTRYYYRITAFEESDSETLPSVSVSAVTKGTPPTPKGLKAQNGQVKMVDLRWTINPEEEVEGYNLYWSKEKTGKYVLLKRIDSRSINSFTHGGGNEKIEDNRIYYYTMTSFNKVDVESVRAETVSATTKPRPVKPSRLKGEALKVKQVPLSWAANPEKEIAFYHVYRSTGSGDDFSSIAKVQGKNSYIDKELKDGFTYRYKIQAEDKDELLSDFSDSISVQTKTKPQKPSGLTGDFRDGKVDLTWKAAIEPDVTHYVVFEKRFFGLEKIDIAKKTTFSDSGLVKGKNKTYAVTSVDRDGLESDPSDEVTVTGR
jgi:fibronectin type 3 domain-containing protein/TolB-like protein